MREITHRQGIYFIRCVQLCEEPEQWYWHLYRDDKRINGGVNDSVEEAMWAAGMNWRRDNLPAVRGERI